jgi:hypothetical protein
MRVGHSEAALERLEVPRHDLLHREIAESHLLRGAVLSRLSRNDEARRSFDSARVHTYASALVALEAELALSLAQLSLFERDLEAAESEAYRTLSLEAYSFEAGPPYFVPLNQVRARAFDLLGFVEARRERYLEQSAFLCRALAEVALCEKRDVWLECSLLANLSLLVRDLNLEGEARILREHLVSEWPVEATGFRFNVLRSLGMWAAVRGDHVGALRDLRAAAEFAPTPTLKLAATLDRALLARELHQSIMAREELDYAERLSSQIDWSNAPGQDRVVLLLQAEVFSKRAVAQGRRALDRFRAIKTKLSPKILGETDKRWRATEVFTEGIVLRGEEKFDAAAVYLAEAFSIWDTIGFRWNAARAALEIAEMTGEERFVEYVRREAELRPNSWLASRVSQLG